MTQHLNPDALVRLPGSAGVDDACVAPGPLAIVVALHVALLSALSQYKTDFTPPPPPVMVTLVAPEPAPVAPEPEIAPPKPLSASPKPVKKKAEPVPEKKAEPQPVAQPEPQLVSKAPETAPPAVEPPAVHHEAAPKVAESAPAVAAAPPAPSAAQADEPVDLPNFNADYLDNPAPRYPPLSRRMGEEGRVLLRVHVAAGGTAKVVTLHKSSGFERLDRAALETVKSWKFVPARQGDKPVDAWVIVPIQFNLKG
jgi:protein TonB